MRVEKDVALGRERRLFPKISETPPSRQEEQSCIACLDVERHAPRRRARFWGESRVLLRINPGRSGDVTMGHY